MVFLGEGAVGFFEFFGGCGAVDAEDFVVVFGAEGEVGEEE